MTSRRWWDLAFAAAAVGLVVVSGLGAWPPSASEFGAATAMGLLIVGYYAFGRFAIGDAVPPWRPLLWCSVMIVLLCVGVAFEPVSSFMQAVIFPSIWFLSPRLRHAIVLNVLTGIAIVVGYVLNSGTDALALGLVNAVLSVTFSMALGLWITRIATLGEERARLLDELTAAQDELAAMHRAAGVVSERERLAREIHDTIAQSLTAQVMLAQRGRIQLGAGAASAAIDGTLEMLETGARDALGEARALVASLTPAGVGDGTLSETLARLAARFERETGVRVAVDLDPALATLGLGRELEVVLLRCSQEGLANVRKHAAASHAWLTLSVTDAAAQLRVGDDGRGLKPVANGDDENADRPAGTGFGVNGMRERVGLVGGTLELCDRGGGGVELRVTVPVSALPTAKAASARAAASAAERVVTS